MPDTENTHHHELDAADILSAIGAMEAGIEKRFQDMEARLKSILESVSRNPASFDCLEDNFLLLHSDVRDIAKKLGSCK